MAEIDIVLDHDNGYDVDTNVPAKRSSHEESSTLGCDSVKKAKSNVSACAIKREPWSLLPCYDLLASASTKEATSDMIDQETDGNEPITSQETPLICLVREIVLPLLPANYVFNLKYVSKQWNRWISSPFFAHKQSYSFRTVSGYLCEFGHGDVGFVNLQGGISDLDFSYLPEKVSVVSSCHGLFVCFENKSYYICNPATRNWRKLPPPNCYHGKDPAVVLAFEPSLLNMGHHYQLVCGVPQLDHRDLQFEIYSSETNSWKTGDSFRFVLPDARLDYKSYFLNGMACWETKSNNFVAFDLKNDTYTGIPLPITDASDCGSLAYIEGELCYISAQKCSRRLFKVNFHSGTYMELKKSVCFDFKMDTPNEKGQILPSINEDTVMILLGGVIYSCNLNDLKVEIVNMGSKLAKAKYFPYVDSLVSVA